MKEIIYIQAGTFSNYIGTHFWNAQESYFTYEEGEDSYVDHDVSFREGQTLKGEPTFCPRLLLFDRKSNFGALTDGMYGSAVDEPDAISSQWNGDVVEFRQPPVPKSKYQFRLEQGEDEVDDEDASDIRYWSDYNRVFYHPRTPQRLPDLADYENMDGDWTVNRETFAAYDEGNDLMDNSFRFLVEECDNMQGLQITNDSTTFGGFTHSFLSAFRDEFTKLPCWTFSVLSESVPAMLNVDDPRSVMKALNDALCLQGLNEMSTLSIPLQSPSLWQLGRWLDGIKLKRSEWYHTSSLLSTHIENMTLPFRLKQSQDTLLSASNILTTRGNRRFAHLSGAFPVESNLIDFETRLYDLSLNTARTTSPMQSNGCIDVSRGFSDLVKNVYSDWRMQWMPEPRYVNAPALSLPSSFPGYFTSPSPTLSAFSTLSTTTRTAILFSQYAKLADECTKQYAHVVPQMGLEMDDVKELRDTLRALEDEYRGDDEDEDGDDIDVLGEDEE